MPLWLDLLPKNVALMQIAWERRQSVARVVLDHGVSQKELARRMGLSPARIQQMVRRASRDRLGGNRAPVTRWMEKQEPLPRELRWVLGALLL